MKVCRVRKTQPLALYQRVHSCSSDNLTDCGAVVNDMFYILHEDTPVNCNLCLAARKKHEQGINSSSDRPQPKKGR